MIRTRTNGTRAPTFTSWPAATSPRGEEITFDYNINLTGGTPIPCNCGAERCHGVIFGDFFALPKAIQREYRPLLAHWFVRRYRHRIEAQDAEP